MQHITNTTLLGALTELIERGLDLSSVNIRHDGSSITTAGGTTKSEWMSITGARSTGLIFVYSTKDIVSIRFIFTTGDTQKMVKLAKIVDIDTFDTVSKIATFCYKSNHIDDIGVQLIELFNEFSRR